MAPSLSGWMMGRFRPGMSQQHLLHEADLSATGAVAGANRFYQALGGRINDHIVNYYLHGESLSKLASGI